MVALMEDSHPRVTRVTLESVENRGSVKIREGSAKVSVKQIIIRTPGVNNKYQQSCICMNSVETQLKGMCRFSISLDVTATGVTGI